MTIFNQPSSFTHRTTTQLRVTPCGSNAEIVLCARTDLFRHGGGYYVDRNGKELCLSTEQEETLQPINSVNSNVD